MKNINYLSLPIEGVEESEELDERFPELQLAVKEDDGRGWVEEDPDGTEGRDDPSPDGQLHVGQPWRVNDGQARARARRQVRARLSRRLQLRQVEQVVLVSLHRDGVAVWNIVLNSSIHKILLTTRRP